MSKQLPDETAVALVAVAREAFAHAYEVTTLISAAVSLVAAMVAVILLRSVGDATQPHSAAVLAGTQ